MTSHPISTPAMRPRPAPRRGRSGVVLVTLAASLVSLLAAAPAAARNDQSDPRPGAPAADSADDLLIVDCLLPHKVRRLGRRSTFLVPRKATRTTAVDCRIRGGEYTEPDQVSYATSLKVWLAPAEAGDAEAQFYVGQIFEKGLGTEPDFARALGWYQRAADQGYTSAQVSLGYFYEEGLGVEADPVAALNWYRQAAGLAENLVVLEAGDYAALEEARDALATKVEEVERLEGEVEALRQQLEEATERSAEEQDRHASLRSILERLQHDLEQSRVQVASGESRLEALQARLAAAEPAAASLPAGASLPALSDIRFGRYHALVIGNSRYTAMPVLEGADADARLVADLLREKYGFTVDLLIDATRYQIMTALNELRATLTEEDNLLVYYAGHGTRDQAGQTAYWQPIDAEPDSPANWIPNAVVTEHLDVIPARHAFVVADSVYSGLRTRSSVARLPRGMTAEQRYYHIRLLRERRARLVLASGEDRPQPAEASGEAAPSRFTSAFLEVLGSNDQVLEASELYRRVNARLGAGGQAAGTEFAPMKWARNDVADFFFVPAGS